MEKKTKNIVTGIVIFAIGVFIAAVGGSYEQSKDASYAVGGITIVGGLAMFIRGLLQH